MAHQIPVFHINCPPVKSPSPLSSSVDSVVDTTGVSTWEPPDDDANDANQEFDTSATETSVSMDNIHNTDSGRDQNTECTGNASTDWFLAGLSVSDESSEGVHIHAALRWSPPSPCLLTPHGDVEQHSSYANGATSQTSTENYDPMCPGGSVRSISAQTPTTPATSSSADQQKTASSAHTGISPGDELASHFHDRSNVFKTPSFASTDQDIHHGYTRHIRSTSDVRNLAFVSGSTDQEHRHISSVSDPETKRMVPLSLRNLQSTQRAAPLVLGPASFRGKCARTRFQEQAPSAAVADCTSQPPSVPPLLRLASRNHLMQKPPRRHAVLRLPPSTSSTRVALIATPATYDGNDTHEAASRRSPCHEDVGAAPQRRTPSPRTSRPAGSVGAAQIPSSSPCHDDLGGDATSDCVSPPAPLTQLRRRWIDIAARFDMGHRSPPPAARVGAHAWRTARAPPDPDEHPAPPSNDVGAAPEAVGGGPDDVSVSWHPVPAADSARAAAVDEGAATTRGGDGVQPLPAALVAVLLTDVRYPSPHVRVCDVRVPAGFADEHNAGRASDAVHAPLHVH
eukprot:m.720660 g.720660  ORF g.720660 m.720660 type:complete len:567 (+) comp23006_c0_seq13:262-1962(+)